MTAHASHAPDHAGPEQIAEAVAVLRRFGLVAFPTETVYGLGAPCFDRGAVERVFALKGRPGSNPLIVHVSGQDMARTVTAGWPRDASLLADAFWPGPLSIVLPKSVRIPAIVTAGGPNAAVRCPDHPTTLALLHAFGEPLVGPSANLSGRLSPTRAEHVRASFPETDVYVLDGGPCRAGIESTVVTLAEDVTRILRPGVIGARELSVVLGRPVLAARDDADGSSGSPGLLRSHYAPGTRTVVVGTAEIQRLVADSAAPVAVLALTDLEVLPPHRAIRMPRDAIAYAAALYASLREADAWSASLIAVERPPEGGPSASVWDAVRDRLWRASARDP